MALWFAFNSGYYDLWLQPELDLISPKTVVICFQFWILRSLITTIATKATRMFLLWFAFNSGYYDLWLQHSRILEYTGQQLWFAFNSGYYDLWLQLCRFCNAKTPCCDLLSILDITIFDYNRNFWLKYCTAVVICFQFWILRSLITTGSTDLYDKLSCDLLSILDITIFDYNMQELILQWCGVVICFQFWILRSLITTSPVGDQPSASCDLLSILDITIFDYNENKT